MRKIAIAFFICVIGWRVASPHIPSVSVATSSSHTLVDDCCNDKAKRLKEFFQLGADKLKSGEFKTTTEFEAWSGAGWNAVDKEAFKPIDEAEGHAVYADDWRAAFEKLWRDWGGVD